MQVSLSVESQEGQEVPRSRTADLIASGRSADLTKTAYERIEELFVTMRLAPGAFLRTQDIQSLVKIGRTPVHQAVQRLSAETLLEVRPRNGLRIAPIDLARERHLAVLRRDLIRFVTDAAMRNMTASDRARVHDLRWQLETKAAGITVEGFNEIDKAFDILLIQASGERFLERALRPLHAIARRTGYLHLTRISGKEGLARSIKCHLDIMDAILRGNVDRIRHACDDLIAYSIDLIDDLEAWSDSQLLDVSHPALSSVGLSPVGSATGLPDT